MGSRGRSRGGRRLKLPVGSLERDLRTLYEEWTGGTDQAAREKKDE